MSRKHTILIWFLVALTSLTLGFISGPIQRALWEEARAIQPEVTLKDLEEGLGQGLILGVVGGFRAVIANFTWLRANITWEQDDISQTESLIRLTTMIDPRPVYFWLNGARIFTYDMPAWRVRAMGVPWGTFPQREERFRREHAQKGIDFIDQAFRFHSGNVQLVLDKAMIYVNRLDDPASAAAVLEPHVRAQGIPFFIPRLYARMVEDSGRPEEALAFLEELLPTLPEDVPHAQVPQVRERIRELREILKNREAS